LDSYSITTDKTWSRILDDLDETFRKWGITSWNVQCDLPPTRTVRQNQTMQERRVMITWKRRDKQHSLTMDKQTRAVDNLLVLQLAIEALRLNEKRGIAATLAEAYRQEFPALPAPEYGRDNPAPTAAYRTLFVQPDAPIEVCEAAFKALAKSAHPDTGGTSARFAAIVMAIEAIRKERA
jgi:hypothetical protein